MPMSSPQAQKEYQRLWMAKRRADFFNGKVCVLCGSTEELELDHIDPSTKEHHSIWSWSETRRSVELAKCQVLCFACHLKKSIAEQQSRAKKIHGTMAEYKRGCRCDFCKAGNAKYEALRRKK